MYSRTLAASLTVLAIGPAVSCVSEIGIIPDRLTKPTVGLIPTTPFTEAGHEIEPFVSVPIATETNPAATATADPELDPQGFLFLPYGFLVCPSMLDQPLTDS